LSWPVARFGSIELVWNSVMSTTRDWMHGDGDDWNRPRERTGLRLGGVISWVIAIAIAAISVLALQNLYG
jgi:hypothetical protein